MSEETDVLIRLVDELVVARNARIRAEEQEAQAARKIELHREKMTMPDATIPGCRV
jgi:hypothetical protein